MGCRVRYTKAERVWGRQLAELYADGWLRLGMCYTSHFTSIAFWMLAAALQLHQLLHAGSVLGRLAAPREQPHVFAKIPQTITLHLEL